MVARATLRFSQPTQTLESLVFIITKHFVRSPGPAVLHAGIFSVHNIIPRTRGYGGGEELRQQDNNYTMGTWFEK